MERYENDLYQSSDYLVNLSNWDYGSPFFYGIRLKNCDLEYDVDECSRVAQDIFNLPKEKKQYVQDCFKENFPELKDRKPSFRFLPHIW